MFIILLALLVPVVLIVAFCASSKKGAFEIPEEDTQTLVKREIIDPSIQTNPVDEMPGEYPDYEDVEDGNSPQLVNAFCAYAIKTEGPKQSNEWQIGSPIYELPTKECDKQHILYEFVKQNNIDMVSSMIHEGINLNRLNNDNGTVLHYAARNLLNDMAKLLIESGARLDVMNYKRQTPLFDAIQAENVDLVKFMLTKIEMDGIIRKMIKESNNTQISSIVE